MRKVHELTEAIFDCRTYIKGVVDLATREERELTKAENDAVNVKLKEIEQAEPELEQAQKISAELKALGAAKLAPMIPGYTGSTSKKLQTDSRGREFAILGKDDRATDIYKPKCENQFGQFVLAKIFGPNHQTPGVVKAALKEGDNSLGGFLVPDQLAGEVIDLARSKSVLMSAGTRTMMMSSESMSVPKLEADVTVETKAENAAATESNLTFGSRELNTYTAIALTKISRELWEDAPQLLAEQIESWLGAKMAQQVDEWGLNGSGSAQPLGLLNFSGISSTGSIGAIDWANVAAGVTTVREANHEPNSIIMDTTIHDDLFNIETGDGTNAARGWLDAPPTIRDKNFLHTTHCPEAKMVIGDFSKFLMGIRSNAMVEASTVAGDSFANHQVWVKIHMRFSFVTLDDSGFHILSGITS